MNVLTVILGSAGPAEGVRDVLTDLSAAGLVSPFLWVQDEAEQDITRVLATEVAGGVESPVLLQDVLASRTIDRVRVCVMVPCSRGSAIVDAGFERSIAELVSSNSGGAKVVRLRLLLHRPGGDLSDSAVLAPAGWHNLLVAPEDSRGPGMGHLSLRATDDPVEIGRHAAPVVAGVAGLWADSGHAPLDELPVLPGNVLRVVRSFYRRLDTSRAEDELRRQVLDFGGHLPLPSDSGTSVVYADDVASTTRAMAQAVWSRHRHLLEVQRVAAAAVPPRREIGLRQAMVLFLSFLGAVLRNAPAALFARAKHKLSSAVASTAQNAVFGSAPAYKLVVNGVDAGGRRAGWEEYEAASKRIAADLDAAAPQSYSESARAGVADLSDLWRDFRRGALTLADGGERSPNLPAAHIGAHRAVLRSASDVVPGPGDRFTDFPGVVSATLDVQAVDPSDVLGINEIREQLRALEQDSALGLEARRTNAVLGTWAQRVGQSYAAAFGGILAQRLYATLDEVRGLVERIGASADLEDIAEVTAQRHRRLVRRVQLLTLVFTAIAVVAGVAAYLGWCSWWIGGTVIAVSVLGWCGSVTREFMSEEQQLFRLLADREAAAAARETAQTNLRAALRDVEIQSAAYRQYLSWSRALGAFLAKPLGTRNDVCVVRRTVEWGLPHSAAVASGSPDQDQIKRVAEQLRHDLLGTGWLSDQWDALVGSAADELGASGSDLRRSPEMLGSQPGAGSGSALDEWSMLLYEGRIEAGGSSRLWERARNELAKSDRELTRRLIDVVEFHEDGRGRRTDLDEFLSGVGKGSEGVDRGFFDRSIFTDLASTKGLTAVAMSPVATVPVGLGMVAVTTQFTEGVAEEDLILTAEGPGVRTEPREILQAPELPVRPTQRAFGQQAPVPAAFTVPVVDGINF